MIGNVRIIGSNVYLSPNTYFEGEATVGHCSCIGFDDAASSELIVIGPSVQIGAFCVLEPGIHIGANVSIDHYCRVSKGSEIGAGAKLLYGVQVFGKARIGINCIIGGDIAERTVLEDEVTFMGEIAHSHRMPTDTHTWDVTDEPSPTIRYGSVVGVNALIIGGLTIGPRSYVGAGEIVRADVPPDSVLYKGVVSKLADWRGVIKVRGHSK